MGRFILLLLVAGLLLGGGIHSFAQQPPSEAQPQAQQELSEAVEAATSTTTTSSPTEVEAESAFQQEELAAAPPSSTTTTTTTLPPFEDLPPAIAVWSDDLAGRERPAGVVIGTDCADNKGDPCAGSILVKPMGLNRAEACEQGVVYAFGHLDRAELFFNLIDDVEDIYPDDKGMEPGMSLHFLLEDGSTCEYRVSTVPEAVLAIPGVHKIPWQEAGFYWSKNPLVASVVKQNLSELYSHEPVMVVAASFAGENADEFRSDGHRANLGAVFLELVEPESVLAVPEATTTTSAPPPEYGGDLLINHLSWDNELASAAIRIALDFGSGPVPVAEEVQLLANNAVARWLAVPDWVIVDDEGNEVATSKNTLFFTVAIEAYGNCAGIDLSINEEVFLENYLSCP